MIIRQPTSDNKGHYFERRYLCELLQEFALSECLIPRDKIYALLSLTLNGPMTLRGIDYACSDAAVYLDVLYTYPGRYYSTEEPEFMRFAVFLRRILLYYEKHALPDDGRVTFTGLIGTHPASYDLDAINATRRREDAALTLPAHVFTVSCVSCGMILSVLPLSMHSQPPNIDGEPSLQIYSTGDIGDRITTQRRIDDPILLRGYVKQGGVVDHNVSQRLANATAKPANALNSAIQACTKRRSGRSGKPDVGKNAHDVAVDGLTTVKRVSANTGAGFTRFKGRRSRNC